MLVSISEDGDELTVAGDGSFHALQVQAAFTLVTVAGFEIDHYVIL